MIKPDSITKVIKKEEENEIVKKSTLQSDYRIKSNTDLQQNQETDHEKMQEESQNDDSLDEDDSI